MSKQFFISATGTDIGKSFYLQKLCQKYHTENQKFHAIKPIISGFDSKDKNNDSALILKALKQENTPKNLDKISPWRFKEALSPNIAAKIENKEIDFNEVVNFCQTEMDLAKKSNINLLIEGAGGIMAPINDKFTFLDLMIALKIPVILVTDNYLGTISHTLTCIKALKVDNIQIAKIIFNNKNNKANSQQNLKNLQNFTDILIETIS